MTSGIIIIIEHAGTDIDPVPYVRYIQCRSNNLGSVYAGSLYLHRGLCHPSHTKTALKVRMGPGRKLPVKRGFDISRGFNGQAGPNRRAAMAAHAAGA